MTILLSILSGISYLELPLTIFSCYHFWNLFSTDMLFPCCALYLMKECYCMSVCLHRYFAHKSFKCSRIVQFFLSFLGCLASQGSPLWWASKHRRHHKYCDTKKDPHSPHAHGKFYAWIGWIYAEGPFGTGTDFEYIQDFEKFPELYVFEVFPWAPVWMVHYTFYKFGGISMLIFVSMLSSILCQLLTLYFNVIFHTGDENLETCRAIDNPMDILSNIFGESYHKHHHTYPKLSKRPGFDIPYWTFIKPMSYFQIFTLS